MVTELGIHASDQRKTIEHRSLFGQVFADEGAWQGCAGNAKGATILDWPIGFGIPRVDLTWTTGHPQEDDTFALGRP